ncbi:MAG TPA: septum formation inhibitor [Bacteroidales bacterium]|nr:septum formation inhibitor [Bacteroidales bacterium]HPS50202.1 septum formation inhibitor [Bacteroidales bacterium]
MEFIKKILRFLLNKYFLTTTAFIVWLVFFDSNNLVTRNKLQQKLDGLNQEKQFYLQEIRKDSTLTRQLLEDSLRLEKFAREQFLMKKEGEDLYLVIDTTEDPHPE